jgi:hypothetical protein
LRTIGSRSNTAYGNSCLPAIAIYTRHLMPFCHNLRHLSGKDYRIYSFDWFHCLILLFLLFFTFVIWLVSADRDVIKEKLLHTTEPTESSQLHTWNTNLNKGVLPKDLWIVYKEFRLNMNLRSQRELNTLSTDLNKGGFTDSLWENLRNKRLCCTNQFANKLFASLVGVTLQADNSYPSGKAG